MRDSSESRPFSEAFSIRKGDAAAIVGCGGKTGLMMRLAEENRRFRTLIATTTRIFPPSPGQIDRELEQVETPVLPGATLAHGGLDPQGKLMPPKEPETLREWFDYSFWECDGSRTLPLKGWAEHEPAVPDFASLTIGVCALWPLGRPADKEIVHRPDLFCRMTGCLPGEPVRLAHIAAMVSSPEGMFRGSRGRRVLFVNQTESEQGWELARQLCELLPSDLGAAVFAGSLYRGEIAELPG